MSTNMLFAVIILQQITVSHSFLNYSHLPKVQTKIAIINFAIIFSTFIWGWVEILS